MLEIVRRGRQASVEHETDERDDVQSGQSARGLTLKLAEED